MNIESIKLMLIAKDELRKQQSFGVCLSGNCDGCHLKSVCNQPIPFIDGHFDNYVDAVCMKFNNYVSELKELMQSKGYENLDDIRGNTNKWLEYLR